MFFKRTRPETPSELIRGQISELRGSAEISVELLAARLTSLEPGWQGRAHEIYREVCLLNEARSGLEDVLATHDEGGVREQALDQPILLGSCLRYSISTLPLRDLAAYLVGDPNGHERIAIVTGPITSDGVRVLSRFEKLAMEGQSAGFVKATNADATKRLIELNEIYGHELLLQAHSHMSYGAAATRPSGIDIENQRRFAQLGWNAVGLIVSLDGYCRFFDPERDFTVDVYGKDAELIEDEPRSKVYRLSKLPEAES